jgi:hypothetical protein
MLQVIQGLGFGWILWNDLSTGKGTCNLEVGMQGASIGQGHRTAVRELATYRRSDGTRVALNQHSIATFSMIKVIKFMN